MRILLPFLFCALLQSQAQYQPVNVMHPAQPLGMTWLGQGDTMITVWRGQRLGASYDKGRTWTTMIPETSTIAVSVLSPREFLRLDQTGEWNWDYENFTANMYLTTDRGATWQPLKPAISSATGLAHRRLVAYSRDVYSVRLDVFRKSKTSSYWKHGYHFTTNAGNDWVVDWLKPDTAYRSSLPADEILDWQYVTATEIIGVTRPDGGYVYDYDEKRVFRPWWFRLIRSGNSGETKSICRDTIDPAVDDSLRIVSATLAPDGSILAGSQPYPMGPITLLRSLDTARTYHILKPPGVLTPPWADRMIMGIFSLSGSRHIIMTPGGLLVTQDDWITHKTIEMQLDHAMIALRSDGYLILERSWMRSRDPDPAGNRLVSTDYGETWTSHDHGWRYNVRMIKAWDDQRWIAGCDNRCALVTMDAGRTWRTVDFNRLFPGNSSPDTLRGLETGSGGVAVVDDFRTTDYGSTWSCWNCDAKPVLTYSTLVSDRQSILIVAGVKPDPLHGDLPEVQVTRSTDFGQSWQKAQTIFVAPDAAASICGVGSTRAVDGTPMLAVYYAHDEGIFHNSVWLIAFASKDEGGSWSRKGRIEVFPRYEYDPSWPWLVDSLSVRAPIFHAYDENRWAVEGGVSTMNQYVWATTDGGESFKNVTEQYPYKTLLPIIVTWASPHELVIQDSYSREFRCFDVDSTYQYRSFPPLQGMAFDSYVEGDKPNFKPVYDNGQLWIIGQGGLIAHCPDWRITSVEAPADVHESPLLQWFPNPGRSRAMYASLSLREVATVHIRAFDVLGREVLAPQHQECLPGHNTIRWDHSSLAAGIYVLVVCTDNAIIMANRVSVVR